jgi:hypothetical protein
MIYALIKKRRKFSLSMLKNGQTISRRQYQLLYEDIKICFSIFIKPNGDNMFCKIQRNYCMGERQINGVTYPCPVPTSNKETFSFYVEGIEPL